MTTAILDVRAAARPGIAHSEKVAIDFAHLFALDCLARSPRPLICHWQRDLDGRLACIWEPDIAPVREH